MLILDIKSKPDAVPYPWDMLKRLPNQADQPLPLQTEISDIFEEMDNNTPNNSPQSYNDWLRERWYIWIIFAVIVAILAQVFISRFPVTIGLLTTYAVSYAVYKMQNPE